MENGFTLFFRNIKYPVALYRGDALEFLKSLDSECVDLIFADPPYFLSDGGITCHSGKAVCVNKGDWDKHKSLEDIHSFNKSWLAECKRILKPHGTIFVSGTHHNIFSVGFGMLELGYSIINQITWFKKNPPPNLSCRCFTHSTETIPWVKKSKNAKHTFNYNIMKDYPDPEPGKPMLDLWTITPPRRRERFYGKHPTQKPEALLERIILAASNNGDVVLDPFCGTGVTGVVAVRLGRQFIGIDQSSEYLDIARKRILDELIERDLI